MYSVYNLEFVCTDWDIALMVLNWVAVSCTFWQAWTPCACACDWNPDPMYHVSQLHYGIFHVFKLYCSVWLITSSHGPSCTSRWFKWINVNACLEQLRQCIFCTKYVLNTAKTDLGRLLEDEIHHQLEKCLS